jgi:hypothetical protein
MFFSSQEINVVFKKLSLQAGWVIKNSYIKAGEVSHKS